MIKTRGFLATAITMTLILSPSMAAAASTDGNEKPTTGPSKTDTGTTAPADGGTNGTRAPSAVENELLQLREELEAERVALDAQQIMTAELEAQLHISTVEPVILASGSTAVTASPEHSGSGVGGFEWQITPRFLIDSYYSGAYFARNFGLLASTATPAPKCDGISGFTCVGFGFPGSANTNNRAIQEGTFGFTQTLWGSAEHGKLQFVTQSSYVVRSPWSVATGNPKDVHAFLEYVDLRYVLP